MVVRRMEALGRKQMTMLVARWWWIAMSAARRCRRCGRQGGVDGVGPTVGRRWGGVGGRRSSYGTTMVSRFGGFDPFFLT